MVQQPVRLWVCKRTKPYREAFVTNNPELAREARKRGFWCRRWHGGEEAYAESSEWAT